MKKYVAYLKSRSTNNILDYGLGDWFDYGPNRPGVAQLTPKSLTATAIYYYDAKLLAQIAATLDKKEDISFYSDQAGEIQKTFQDHFSMPKKVTLPAANGYGHARAWAVKKRTAKQW